MKVHWKNVRIASIWYSLAGLYTLAVVAVAQ
jgi:hypothetical protein